MEKRFLPYKNMPSAKSHYSLAEAADLLHCKPMDLIHKAVHEQITLLVGVPDNVRFRTYDAAADVAEAPALLEPQLLALMQSHCLKIELNGKTEQCDFREGYLLDPSGRLQKLMPSYGRPNLNHLWAFWRTYEGPLSIKIELVPERLFVVGSDLQDLLSAGHKIEQTEKTIKAANKKILAPIRLLQSDAENDSESGFEKGTAPNKSVVTQQIAKAELPSPTSSAINTSNRLEPNQPNIIRLKQVLERTGLSRSTIYDKINPKSSRFDPLFPKQLHLGTGSVGWVESEITAWLDERKNARC